MADIELVIKIPEEYYKAITEIPNHQCTADMLIIKNGTPIPDNATNGDVIKAMFEPNWIRRMDAIVTEGYEFNEVWWNSPYQKGGKE